MIQNNLWKYAATAIEGFAWSGASKAFWSYSDTETELPVFATIFENIFDYTVQEMVLLGSMVETSIIRCSLYYMSAPMSPEQQAQKHLLKLELAEGMANLLGNFAALFINIPIELVFQGGALSRLPPHIKEKGVVALAELASPALASQFDTYTESLANTIVDVIMK